MVSPRSMSGEPALAVSSKASLSICPELLCPVTASTVIPLATTLMVS